MSVLSQAVRPFGVIPRVVWPDLQDVVGLAGRLIGALLIMPVICVVFVLYCAALLPAWAVSDMSGPEARVRPDLAVLSFFARCRSWIFGKRTTTVPSVALRRTAQILPFRGLDELR